MSAAQRFTHTLGQLGLLRRDPATKLYELSPRMLDFAYQFIGANELVGWPRRSCSSWRPRPRKPST